MLTREEAQRLSANTNNQETQVARMLDECNRAITAAANGLYSNYNTYVKFPKHSRIPQEAIDEVITRLTELGYHIRTEDSEYTYRLNISWW